LDEFKLYLSHFFGSPHI